jgi:hypothetical protein
MYAGKVALDCIRAAMALIAALSGSSPLGLIARCTGRDNHSPKCSEVKFSRRDGVRRWLVCHEREAKAPSLPIRIGAAQGCTAKIGSC